MVAALAKHGNQEKYAFQTFARHGEKRHQNQRPARTALIECGLDGILQMLLHRTGRLLHPQHHIGQHAHCRQTDCTDDEFLFLLRDFTGKAMDGKADTHAQQRGGNHAQPDFVHQMMMPGLFQKTGHDADNQRGLYALAQHN